jgi:branched-chain amino acid transport system permease protein
MRIANLTHGALFMLGAYLGASTLKVVPNLWLAALITGAIVAVLGGVFERLILRKLGGNVLGQVLVTLGVSFIIADLTCAWWYGAATRSRSRRRSGCSSRCASPGWYSPPTAWRWW